MDARSIRAGTVPGRVNIGTSSEAGCATLARRRPADHETQLRIGRNLAEATCAVNDDRIHLFGAFTLDLGRGVLLREGEPVHLRPQAYEALRFLVEHRGRLVSKDALIEAVWQGRAVSDDSLVQCL